MDVDKDESGSEPHGLRQFQVHDSKKGDIDVVHRYTFDGSLHMRKLPKMIRMEKEGRAGVEPATYRAATDCSTTELTPRPYTRRNSGNNNKVNTNTNAAFVHWRDMSYIYSVMTTKSQLDSWSCYWSQVYGGENPEGFY